jgi:DNA-binding NarL/FixJ family response regulator
MIKVIIADDQLLLTESFKSIIERDPDITVTGCAENGHEAFRLCEISLPDLVLMDIKMPTYNGIEGTRMIKEKYPQIKVLILTTFEDDQNVYEALKNGADGYILKEITPEELIQAIKNTVKGFGIFSKTPFSLITKQFSASCEKDDPAVNISDFNLKERDIEILRLIADGLTNKDIASKLCLSLGRTKNIISELMAKLELEDRNQLASFAFKNKLV